MSVSYTKTEMDYKFIYSVVALLIHLSMIHAEIYDVNIRTDRHINEVDNKFFSFTIDPKYLISASEKYNKECLCMASSLSPSYLRLAGTSTSRLNFRNSSIVIDEGEEIEPRLFSELSDESHSIRLRRSDWSRFVKWAKNSGFELVFALNNHHRTRVMWDANVALSMLTAAEKQRVGEMYWQLGYECSNQTIEEYLNDLETLRVIVETFPSGRSGKWKVVGGDITKCLHGHSKSDFKDYVVTTDEKMDAIFLDGNSTSEELSRMSPRVHSKLLQRLSVSATPLWWSSRAPSPGGRLTSLGTAAATGFTVHYQELAGDELCQPSLNLYVSILYKHLVGNRVLSIPSTSVPPPGLSVFAQCSSLRGREAPGAITIYGVNDRQQHAAFTLNITSHDGDMLLFILGYDTTGNIVVNDRSVTRHGHIEPAVRRVRSHKPLVLDMPPKSLGFWVLANAQVEACYSKAAVDKFNRASRVNDEDNFIKTKRSIDKNEDITYTESTDETRDDTSRQNNIALRERIDSINRELKKIYQNFEKKSYKLNMKRDKREACEHEPDNKQRKTRASHKLKSRRDYDKLLGNIFPARDSKFSKDKILNIKNKLLRLRGAKRHSGRSPRKTYEEKYTYRGKSDDLPKTRNSNKNEIMSNVKDISTGSKEKKVRSRRGASNKLNDEDSTENDIDNTKETFKIGKIFNNIKKLSQLPIEIQNKGDIEDYRENGSEEGIVLKTALSDDSATLDITEKSHSGLLKSTLYDIFSLLADFNKNVNRLWTAVTIFE